MHNLLTELFELFYAIERVPQKKFKAKMLTTQFVEPMRFFSRVKNVFKQINNINYINIINL